MTIEQAAKEFGLHSRLGGWRLGYLVAACVERGTGQGARKPHRNRDKVSAQEFGRKSGTSADRVLRHLTAWEKAAADGLVPPAEEITLDSEFSLPDDLPAWDKKDGGYYEAVGGGYNGGTDRQPTVKQAKAVIAQLPPQEAATVVTEALDTDEVIEAVNEDETAAEHVFAATTKLAGSRGKSSTKKKNRKLEEMTVALQLIGVLSQIRDLAREDSDSPLIKQCKSLMRETLEILDGIEEADDPEAVDRMLAELGDFLATQ